MNTGGDDAERKVDRTSQRLLLELDRSPETAPNLRDELGLDQTQQIHYRVREHLSDWVTAAGTEARPGATHDATIYQLTEEGRDYVSQHRDEWDTPVTLSETRETAREALKEASSAKTKADTARKNYSEVRSKLGSLEDRVDKLPDERQIKLALAPNVAERVAENEPWNDDVDDLDERLNDLEGRVVQVEQTLAGETVDEKARRRTEKLQRDLSTLEKEVSFLKRELKQERQRGLLDHLLPWR